jgi:DNA polymerase III gamma/tau subunit
LGSADRALGLVHTFQKEGRNLQHFCREAIRHMRNLLIARVCGADSDLIAATPDQRPALERAAAQFSEEDLTRFFQILLQTDDDLRRKPDPRVHLEMGLLRLINASRLAPLEELLAEVRGGAPTGSTATASSRTTSAAPASISAAPRRDVSTAPAPSAIAPRVPSFEPAPPTRFQTPRFQAEERESVPERKAAPAQEPPQGAQTPATPTSAQTSGITDAQVAEIKQAIQAQQKFLGELVEHGIRWELEGAELRIYFSPDKRPFAETLEGREPLEKVRVASSKVLGRAVRVCAKLEAVAAAAASASRSSLATQELRAQFERDPMVKSMLQRFGGKIAEVKHRPEET